MKEHPILFKADMVRAILDGRKTQTRRVIRPQPDKILQGDWSELCKYKVGDRLWVREAWAQITFVKYSGVVHDYIGIRFRADNKSYLIKANQLEDWPLDEPLWQSGWKSPIFMFKKHARLWLEITGIRAQRVQDISESDAKAEGTEPCYIKIKCGEKVFVGYFPGFQPLWDSINAKRGYGWDTNCWVWVIEFRKVKDGN